MEDVVQYVIVGLAVVVAAAWLIVKIVRTVRRASRGRGCEGCPMADGCHKCNCGR
ncbi:MAG: hypothetical protein ACI35Q_01045 [Marinilabiliaceae bacterium]